MRVTSPCFTPGTLIATERGQRPVEMLRRGDRVVTRDNGLKRITWAGRRTFGYRDISQERTLLPVLVRAGALGSGRPERDMIVSPNHRFLIGACDTPLQSGQDEHLVAARHLVGSAGVTFAKTLGISYFHIMCNAHEVILANGAWTESFHPDDEVMRALGAEQRREILALFPEIATIGAKQRFAPVRPIREDRSRFET